MVKEAVRFLFLNQTFPPDPVATSQYLFRLAAHLVQEGDEVTVVTSRRSYQGGKGRHAAREICDGVKVVRVWNSGWGRGTRVGRAIDALTFLIGAARAGLSPPRPEVIVALTSPPLLGVLGAILAGMRGARFVYWVMDLNPDAAVAAGWLRADSWLARGLEALSCWSLRRADRVVVLDRFMSERLRQKEIPAEKIAVIPPGMQKEARFDATQRAAFRRKHGLEDRFVVMYAGNHGPCHPLETLIDAAALLRENHRIHFCFVGGGSEWARLGARIARERITNVTRLNYVPFAELGGCLSGADLQVVAMGASFIGMLHPCKVYNFLAAERPFVYLGPDAGPIGDIIREGQLGKWTSSFREGQGRELADELIRRAGMRTCSPWPMERCEERWGERRILEDMTTVLRSAGRCNKG
jgi:colanic acid biosynthesis glycosyl transferase WcaI